MMYEIVEKKQRPHMSLNELQYILIVCPKILL